MEKIIEIPEGYEARIEGNKVILESKESENERIRNLLYCLIRDRSDNGKLLEHNGVTVDMALAWIEKQGKPKMAANAIREGVAHYGITQYQIDNWLKKYVEVESTEPKSSAWTEEDEGYYNSIIEHLKYSITNGKPETYKSGRLTDFLKSLKERYTWKPSDEQMNTLWDAIVYVEGCDSNFKGGSVLENLYSDLKKLKR